MKKLFYVLTVCLLAAGMLACGGKKEAQKTEQEKPQINQQELQQKLAAMSELKAQFDQAKTKKEKDDIIQKLYRAANGILNVDPNNVEANKMMDFVQLYYAEGWIERGKYSKARDMVENVLEFSPDNEQAKQLLEKIKDWEYLTRDEFKQIKRGMTMEEVQSKFGYPLEKLEQKDKYGRSIVVWVYREPDLKKKVVLYFFANNGELYAKLWPKDVKPKKKK